MWLCSKAEHWDCWPLTSPPARGMSLEMIQGLWIATNQERKGNEPFKISLLKAWSKPQTVCGEKIPVRHLLSLVPSTSCYFQWPLDQARSPTAKELQFDCPYQKDNAISWTGFYSAGITGMFQLLCTTPQAQSSYKPGEVGFMAVVCWQGNRVYR